MKFKDVERIEGRHYPVAFLALVKAGSPHALRWVGAEEFKHDELSDLGQYLIF